MTEEISKESLSKSEQIVGQLYPVIVNQTGKVLDGNHRVEENPSWHKKVVETKSRAEEILVRIHAHHRRRVSQEETKAMLLELAAGLEASGTECRTISAEITKLTPYSDRYIQMLLPEKYKQPEKVEAGKVAAQISEQKREQPMGIQCSCCPMSTYSPKDWQGKLVCTSCYDKLSQGKITLKEPKAIVEKSSVEMHKYKPEETAEHRKAVMTPSISKMDEAVFLILKQNEDLRNAGWKFQFQKPYCLLEVVSDVTATRGDVEQPLFFDGEVHFGREERDEANRELLVRRLGIPEVLAFTYEGAYSDAKRDEIVAKIVEMLK